MKTINAQLIAHLQEEVTTLCTCWRIERQDGVVLCFTDHDQDIVFDNEIYRAQSGFIRSAISNTAAVSTDELQAQGFLDSELITEQDLRAGKFDYAEVWVFLINWANPSMGKVPLRYGRFGEVTITSTGRFEVELRGLINHLEHTIGQTYTPECRTDLGSPQCGVVLIPPFRTSSQQYKKGNRIRVRDDADRDRSTRLNIPNGGFEGVQSIAQSGWDANGVITQNIPHKDVEGNCFVAVTWEGDFRQEVVIEDVFGIPEVEGATATFSIRRQAYNDRQESRLHCIMKDEQGNEIGTASSYYRPGNRTFDVLESITFEILPGTRSIECVVQFRKRNTKFDGPEELFRPNDGIAFAMMSLKIQPKDAAIPTEALTNGTLTESAGDLVEGWRSGVLTSSFVSVPQRYQLFARNNGHFLMFTYSLGSGSSNYIESEDPVSLTAGDIRPVDIDYGQCMLDLSWWQASWDDLGEVGVGVAFYNSDNQLIQRVNPVLEGTHPRHEWQQRTRTIPVPVGSRTVRFRIEFRNPNLGEDANRSTAPTIGIDDIEAYIRLNRDNSSPHLITGVEYEAQNDGISDETPPTFNKTIGSTTVDGSVVWKAVVPQHTFLGTIDDMESRGKFSVTGIDKPDGWFNWGILEFLDGDAAGYKCEIVRWTRSSRQVELFIPPANWPKVGDKVIMTTGCDKSRASCRDKFKNIINFRGEPDLPGTDQYFQVGNPSR